MSDDEIVALLMSHEELKQQHEEQRQQLEWFKRQLFGSKSERRLLPENVRQLALGEALRPSEDAHTTTTTVREHRRVTSTPRADEETALRFDPSVPVEIIDVPNPEIQGKEHEYRLVGEKTTDRLAQRPGSYVVLRYQRKVYKHKDTDEFSCPPAPPAVLDKSFADVSFLAGMVIDKFRYHLPLYRQHQRLAAAGISIGRSTLTSFVQRVADLLEPIYRAQLASIVSSQVLTMDETPIRAGRKAKGKMKTGYFWPIYGDKDEIAFPFSPSRALAVVEEALQEFCGVLQTDGFKVYDLFVQRTYGVVHAQCWSHTRRLFVEAESMEPKLAGEALDRIGALYAQETLIRDRRLVDEKKLLYRAEQCKPLVDQFFAWLATVLHEQLLLPTSPFTKAAAYAVEREAALRVFLEYPDVAVDTNHLEREIRPIAVGRKNWLFCWTEVGAEDVGIIHSLLATCRLQGVDPYTYLVDVLQRVATHPAREVTLLTPRLWKQHFAREPMRSDLGRGQTRAE